MQTHTLTVPHLKRDRESLFVSSFSWVRTMDVAKVKCPPQEKTMWAS